MESAAFVPSPPPKPYPFFNKLKQQLNKGNYLWKQSYEDLQVLLE